METNRNNQQSHIMCYQYTEDWGSIQREMVALFDERDLTEAQAIAAALVDEGNAKIVIMTKAQYETVFRSLMNQREMA